MKTILDFGKYASEEEQDEILDRIEDWAKNASKDELRELIGEWQRRYTEWTCPSCETTGMYSPEETKCCKCGKSRIN